jgi:hypothetical protein
VACACICSVIGNSLFDADILGREPEVAAIAAKRHKASRTAQRQRSDDSDREREAGEDSGGVCWGWSGVYRPRRKAARRSGNDATRAEYMGMDVAQS